MFHGVCTASIFPMNRKRLKLVKLGSLAAFFSLSWIGYSTFINGRLPGIYPLAVLHSWISTALLYALLLIFIYWQVALLMIPLSLVLLLIYRHQHRRSLNFAGAFSQIMIVVVSVVVSIVVVVVPTVVLLLMTKVFSPGQQLAVQPWNQVYRTAFSGLRIDDNNGDVLLFKCDRTGIFCRRIHNHYSALGSQNYLPLTYDAASDQLTFGTKHRFLYIRSKTKTLCKTRGDDVGLVPPPPGSGVPPQKRPDDTCSSNTAE